jgi:cellulose synthase operon protein C
MSQSHVPAWRRGHVWASVAAFSMLMACSGQDPAQLIAAGRVHLDKKEYRAAAIEFKNALQKNGDLNEARLLLGRTLLESGDSSGALVELNKLRAASYDPDQVAPVLARAQLAQGELDKLIADWADTKLGAPKPRAELAAALAAAYAARGKAELAEASANASLKDDPEGLSGLLVTAQLKAMRDDLSGAMDDVARAERIHPNAVRPKLFKAQLMAKMRGRFDNATIAQVYRDVLTLDPKEVQAHAGLIQHALVQKDTAAANAQLEALHKAHPGALPTYYFTALLALERRDLRAAQDAIQQVLKGAPENVPALQLAGRIAFEAGNYAQAAAHLGKALPRTTQAIPVRLLLARALLRAGDNKKALTTLQPLLNERTGVPAEAYTLAADAQVRLGENEAAKQLYQRAISVDPRDERARSALAVFDIDEGRLDRGVLSLKEVARTSANLEADVLVAATYLRSRHLEQAREAIDVIEKKQPNSSTAATLRGELALAQGKVDEAARQFEDAAQRNPKDFAPVTALLKLDQRAGKDDAAVARLRGFLEKNPRSLDADLALVSLGKSKGNAPGKVVSELELLVKKYSDSELPRVALVRALLEAGEIKRAQAVAKEAAGAFPGSAAVVEAVGVAELAAGNVNQALQAFSQFATLQPKQATPLMRLSQAHLANKDVPGALSQLTKAVALEPSNVDAQFQLVSLLARAGKADLALTQARAAQAAAPADPVRRQGGPCRRGGCLSHRAVQGPSGGQCRQAASCDGGRGSAQGGTEAGEGMAC